MTNRAARRRSRPLRTSVLAGGLLALAVLGAGAAYAPTQQATYTAESVLVVLPRADLDDATSAAFYETMSRGQIVGTFAEVANNPTFQEQALDQLQLDDQQRRDVTTDVSVVPDTSVILVRVTSPSAAVASQVADATTRSTTRYLVTLTTAYRTQVVQDGADAMPSGGLTPTLVLLLAAVVALVLGLGVQQAVYHLLLARRLAVPAAEPAAEPGAPASTPTGRDELSLVGRT